MSKAIVDLKDFQAAVKRVSSVLNKRSSFQELKDCVTIRSFDDSMMITATDLNVTHSAFLDCTGCISEFIKLSNLDPIMRYKPKNKTELIIETLSDVVVFRADDVAVKCKPLDKDFCNGCFQPKVFDKDYKRMIQIRYSEDCKVFKDSLSCVSDDESRPAFTGVAYQTYNLVSTNGMKLYKGMMSPINDDSFRGIMNTKLIKAIAGGLTGKLYERKQKTDGTTYHVLIADNGDVIISQSVSKDDDFPDFFKIIPKSWNGKAEIDKHIYDIIKTYATGFKYSTLCFLEKETVIRQRAGERDERHFERIEGMPVGLAVDTRFFLQAIELFKDELKYDKTIPFCWVDCDSPMWVGKELSKVWGGGTGPDYLHGNGTLVMPVQL